MMKLKQVYMSILSESAYKSKSYKNFVSYDKNEWKQSDRATFYEGNLFPESELSGYDMDYKNMPDNSFHSFLKDSPQMLYFQYIHSKYPRKEILQYQGHTTLPITGSDKITNLKKFKAMKPGWGTGKFEYWEFSDAIIFKTV